jgi:hypothetical protein
MNNMTLEKGAPASFTDSSYNHLVIPSTNKTAEAQQKVVDPASFSNSSSYRVPSFNYRIQESPHSR